MYQNESIFDNVESFVTFWDEDWIFPSAYFCIEYSPFFMFKWTLYDVGPRRHKQKQEMHQSGKELPESKAWKGFWKTKTAHFDHGIS